jgi:hypothetical protein
MSVRFQSLAVLLLAIAAVMPSCNDGCVTCSGITADYRVCEDDYQEASDFTAYINEYEAQGGICEE